MKPAFTVAVLATLLSIGAAHAAQDAPAKTEASKTEAPKTEAQVEAQLKAARERLEQAAKEVAELSSQLSEPVMDRLMLFAHERPAIIGVQLDPDSGKEGARIVEVSPGGPAAEAGVRSGDVIVAVNGTNISGDKSAREVTKRMRDVEPQDKVKLRVMRDGKAKDFEITARAARGFVGRVAAVPAMPAPPPSLDIAKPFTSWTFPFNDELAGMELATLTPALGRYFGTEKGVLVVRAPDRASFKLEDGDVILAIGGREPKSGSHATRILRSYQAGEKIDLKVMRQRKTTNLEVMVPEAEGPKAAVRVPTVLHRTHIIGADDDENVLFEAAEPVVGPHVEAFEQ
jgi:predicted metalloprotease with PDZ domain